jgi:hypothetical protein
MTDLNETLAGMRAKTDAATLGPWGIHRFGTSTRVGIDWSSAPTSITGSVDDRDAEFIAMARTAMPALLSAVQNVLALCNRAPGYPGTVRKSDVRKALTDALEGGE